MGAFCSTLTSDYILNYPVFDDIGFPEVIPVLNPDNLTSCPVYELPSLSSSKGKDKGRSLRQRARNIRSNSKGKGSRASTIPCAANTFEFVCQAEAGIEHITMCKNSAIVRPAFDLITGLFEFAVIPLNGISSVTCEEEPCFIARSATCGGLPEFGNNETTIQSQCATFVQSAFDPTPSLSITGFNWLDFCGNGEIVKNYNNFGFNLTNWDLSLEEMQEATGELIAYVGEPGTEVTDFKFGGDLAVSRSSKGGGLTRSSKGKELGKGSSKYLETQDKNPRSDAPFDFVDQPIEDNGQSTGQGATCHDQVVASILEDLDSDGDGVVDGSEISNFLAKARIDLSQLVRRNDFSEDNACR
eukprot:scaffold1033_cov171-Amphora_coffeaeformis.AAC.14